MEAMFSVNKSGFNLGDLSRSLKARRQKACLKLRKSTPARHRPALHKEWLPQQPQTPRHFNRSSAVDDVSVSLDSCDYTTATLMQSSDDTLYGWNAVNTSQASVQLSEYSEDEDDEVAAEDKHSVVHIDQCSVIDTLDVTAREQFTHLDVSGSPNSSRTFPAYSTPTPERKNMRRSCSNVRIDDLTDVTLDLDQPMYARPSPIGAESVCCHSDRRLSRNVGFVVPKKGVKRPQEQQHGGKSCKRGRLLSSRYTSKISATSFRDLDVSTISRIRAGESSTEKSSDVTLKPSSKAKRRVIVIARRLLNILRSRSSD